MAPSTPPTCLTQGADVVTQAPGELAVPGAPGADPTQSQAGLIGSEAGLAPKAPRLGLQTPSQPELSWQDLAAVLGEDARHGVYAGAVPCRLMLVPQEEAQHGGVSSDPDGTCRGRQRICTEQGVSPGDWAALGRREKDPGVRSS